MTFPWSFTKWDTAITICWPLCLAKITFQKSIQWHLRLWNARRGEWKIQKMCKPFKFSDPSVLGCCLQNKMPTNLVKTWLVKYGNAADSSTFSKTSCFIRHCVLSEQSPLVALATSQIWGCHLVHNCCEWVLKRVHRGKKRKGGYSIYKALTHLLFCASAASDWMA